MSEAATVNDDILDVMSHVREMADKYGFSVNPDNAVECVEESAFHLGIALDQTQKRTAAYGLINEPA